jgi:hypothetical protein
MISNTHYVSSAKTLNGALETWFIQNNLLGGLPPAFKESTFELDHKNIIYLELFDFDAEFIEKIKNRGKKIVLIHMGDELAKKNISAYGSANLILRNYYFPDIFSRPDIKDRILWIPNGFRTGIGPRNPLTIKLASNREYLASFMGWIQNPDSFKRERDSFGRMVRGVRKSKKSRLDIFLRWIERKIHANQERRTFSESTFNCDDLYLLSSSGFATGNNLGLYSAVMENSVFAPCPAGNSPETIRLYDALESGAIPITLEHEFIRSTDALAALGEIPFPVLNSWDELPEFLSSMKLQLQDDPDLINALQTKCISWWSQYKIYISTQIKQRIESL